MSIMQKIVITIAYLQLAKSKTMLRNGIKTTSTVPLLSSEHFLQQNHDTDESANFPNDTKQINHHLMPNFTTNGIKTPNTPDSITKKNLCRENFTINEFHEESERLLHKKVLSSDLENDPGTKNEKNLASIRERSLHSDNDDINNSLILLILSVFFVTLVLVVSFAVYTRNSHISLELNDNNSKDEKKLRYREVATEEQPIDVVNSDENWRDTLVSKIITVTRRLKSLSDSSTSRNVAEVQISSTSTPSTHTLSSKSHHSIEMESCTNTANKTEVKNISSEKEGRGETVSRTQSYRKYFSFRSNKAHDENLDTSNSICSKCNHYRDPQIVVKRINEIQRRGGRIHIPVRVPVILGSNKIKSPGFHKISSNQSTVLVHKKCHRGSCSIATKSSRASSTSGCFQKKVEELDVSASSTCRSKATDDCLPTCSSIDLHQNEDNCNDEWNSSTGKSKSKDDCPLTIGSTYTKRSIADLSSSTRKSKSNDGVPSSSSSSDSTDQDEDEQCYAIYNSSSEKSQENYGCIPSKSSAKDQDNCSENRSIKSSASSKCKSKPESSSYNYPNSSNVSTNSGCMNTDYESSARTQNSESQTEDNFRTIGAYTDKTGIYDVSDETSKNSSSTYDAKKVKICEKNYNDQKCQFAPSEKWYTNSSTTCSTKLSESNLPSTIGSHQSIVKADTSKIQSQPHDKPNTKNPKTKSTEGNCEHSNQKNRKCTRVSQSNNQSTSGCSNVAYKAPVKFKVLSTDPNFDPSTLQVKQQLKLLLSEDHSSKKQTITSNEDKLQPGQVIYADLCFVQQSAAESTVINTCLEVCENKNSGVCSQSSCPAVLRKHPNLTSESESDHGYGASQTESAESEDQNGFSYGKDHNEETDSYYGNCESKICCDDSPRINLSRRFNSGWRRRSSIDNTLKSSSSADSRGMLIQSLNQRLKGTYLRQTKGSSRSKLASSSRCTPVLEYTVDDDDYDVYEPVQEQEGTNNRSMRNSMNKLLPKIRSYMSRRKKCSTSGSEQVYEDPSISEGTTELCENCLKHVPNDISKTIRSRQSLYSNVDKFKSGGTIHLNDLIEIYPNLYPKLPSPIREALSKGFDEVSTSHYGNLCDNYELVQERKWSELSSSFENINYTD